ncbi:MAG: hypothetical protein ACKOLA_09790 [Spartobacteria bacterium]
MDTASCSPRRLVSLLARGGFAFWRGGKIREAVRRELGRKLSRGEVRAVVHGESYSPNANAARDLLSRFKELKATERPDSGNLGLTIIEF